MASGEQNGRGQYGMMYHRSWMLYHVCKRLSQTYYISTFLELHLSPTAMVDGPDKTVSRQRQQLFSSRIAYVLFIYPVEFFLSLVASVLRPIAPQLIPFAVFFLLVPLLVVPAVISGLYVWYSRAISWETPLFFQYGCVFTLHSVRGIHSRPQKRWASTLRRNSARLI